MNRLRNHLLMLASAAASFSISTQASAQSLTFLGDNNTDYPALRRARDFTQAGNNVYFVADGPLGAELYKTDGTTDSIQLVADLYPGTNGSHPYGLTALGSTLFFAASDGQHGNELWKIDTTTGQPLLVADIVPGATGSVSNFSSAVHNGHLYFVANSRLYKTDGTDAGTVQLSDVTVVGNDTLCTSGQFVYFKGTQSSTGEELWRTDGTPAGTILVKGINPGSPASSLSDLTDLNGILYFSAKNSESDSGLWRSDGTPGGTVPVTPSYVSRVSALAVASGALYFEANTSSAGYELWTTAETGTPHLLKDIASGTSHGSPDNLTPVGGMVFFTSDNGTSRSLFVTDGTAAGTTELVPDVGFIPYQGMGAAGGYLYFPYTSAPSGTELWRTDGSISGTMLAYDLESGTASSDPATFISIGNDLYFSTASGLSSYVPYRIDGATQQLVTFNLTNSPDSAGLYIDRVPLITNGKIYFTGWDGAYGWEPWVTDGTPEGTHMLADLNPGPADSSPLEFVEFQGSVYFAAQDPQGYQLYKTDGTLTGSIPFKKFNAAQIGKIVSGGTHLYIFANIFPESTLWRTDGTESATIQISTPGNPGYRSGVFSLNDGILLAYDDPTQNIGSELWKAEGTTDSLVFVKDINPGWDHSMVGTQVNSSIGGKAIFRANDGVHGTELWISDGTPEGTELLSDMAPGSTNGGATLINPIYENATIDGKIFFFANNTANPGLWVTDGTPVGTQYLAAVNQAFPASLQYNQFVALGNHVVFPGTNTAYGREIWITDGTAAGTHLLKDINPGSVGSGVNYLMLVGNYVYFVADNGVHGTELWRTDGTSGGTVLVRDINPGTASSNPKELVHAGNSLVFAAKDGIHGEEPWYHNAITGATGRIADLEAGGASSWPVRILPLGNTIVFQAYTSETGADLWSANFTPPASANDWQLFE